MSNIKTLMQARALDQEARRAESAYRALSAPRNWEEQAALNTAQETMLRAQRAAQMFRVINRTSLDHAEALVTRVRQSADRKQNTERIEALEKAGYRELARFESLWADPTTRPQAGAYAEVHRGMIAKQRLEIASMPEKIAALQAEDDDFLELVGTTGLDEAVAILSED